MKNQSINVFDVNLQKHMGKVTLDRINFKYDQWRAMGYGVLIDRDGEICLDNEDSEDDGKYYKEQIADLNKLTK